jgi:HK97 family phage prohead protease
VKFETRKAFVESKPREERQFTTEVEFRDGDEGTGLHLTGYASLTGVPYEVNDMFGSYTETVQRGAFKKALREKDDTRLLVNHEGIPIARTKSGTLKLSEDEQGLHVDAPSLDGESPLVQTVRSAMKRGDLDQMSFAFQATRQEWNEDYSQRTIREVRLFDVSVVTYPASPSTEASLRGEELPEPTIVVAPQIGQRSLVTFQAMRDALDLDKPA